jgi:hypothetical protein
MAEMLKTPGAYGANIKGGQITNFQESMVHNAVALRHGGGTATLAEMPFYTALMQGVKPGTAKEEEAAVNAKLNAEKKNAETMQDVNDKFKDVSNTVEYQLKSSFVSLSETLGVAAEGSLKKLTDQLKLLVDAMALSKTQISDVFDKLGVVMLALGPVMWDLGSIIFKVVQAFQSTAATMIDMNEILNPGTDFVKHRQELGLWREGKTTALGDSTISYEEKLRRENMTYGQMKMETGTGDLTKDAATFAEALNGPKGFIQAFKDATDAIKSHWGQGPLPGTPEDNKAWTDYFASTQDKPSAESKGASSGGLGSSNSAENARLRRTLQSSGEDQKLAAAAMLKAAGILQSAPPPNRTGTPNK